MKRILVASTVLSTIEMRRLRQLARARGITLSTLLRSLVLRELEFVDMVARPRSRDRSAPPVALGAG